MGSRSVKLKLHVGLVSIAARAEKATDSEDSGLHVACTGPDDAPHAPSRVRQSATCPVCETSHSSHYGFPQRARQEGDTLILVTAEELAGARGEPRRTDVDLAFHPREKVFAATLAADSVQYLSPDKGGEKAYVALRDVLRDRPDIVACTVWAPSKVNALWVIEHAEGRLVMSKRCWPEAVRLAPAIPDVSVPDAEAAMFGTLVDSLVADFDLGVYVDESKRNLEELLAAKAGDTAAVTSPTGGASATDLLSALQASIDAAKPKKKPAARKRATPKEKAA